MNIRYHHHLIIIYPLTARVVGASQFPPFSVFSTALWDLALQACPFPDVVLSPLPLSALSSSPFHCTLQDGVGRHIHTTAVCASLRWSGGLRVVRLPAGPWHGLPGWKHGLCRRCVVSCGSTSFPWLVFFFGALL